VVEAAVSLTATVSHRSALAKTQETHNYSSVSILSRPAERIRPIVILSAPSYEFCEITVR
jgi:hypothetical protein